MGTARLIAGLAAAALVGGVIGTAFIAPALRDTATSDVHDVAPNPRVEESARRPEPTRSGRRAKREEVPDDATAPASQPIDDLAPTDEERAWLRTALVAERERRQNAVIRAEDSGVDVLGRYLKSRADVEPVLANFDAARAHVRTPPTDPVRFPSPDAKGGVDLSSATAASIVEFGPGRFDLRASRGAFFDRRASVDALEIRGAGKDATTLVLGRGQEFMFVNDARNVVFKDLTIENPAGDATIFDVRGTASFAFERVRFAGWLASAGHSAVLGTSGQSFVACRDCDFQAGGGGFVLSMRGPCLAVFERCTFSDTESVFIAGGAASGGRPSVVRAIDCTFQGTRLADSRIRRGAADDVDLRVRGGSVRIGAADVDDAGRRKLWGAEFAASVEDVTFAAEPPRVTGADFVRVLDLAAAQGWNAVVHAAVTPGARTAPMRFDLYVASQNNIDRHVVDLVDGSLREVANVRQGRAGVSVQTGDDVSALLPLRTLLSRQPDLAAAGVTSVSFHRGNINGSERWLAGVNWGSGSHRLIDATTGDTLGPK